MLRGTHGTVSEALGDGLKRNSRRAEPLADRPPDRMEREPVMRLPGDASPAAATQEHACQQARGQGTPADRGDEYAVGLGFAAAVEDVVLQGVARAAQKREEKSLMRSTCFLKILLDSTASPLPGQPFFPEFCKEIKNLFYFLLTSTFVRFIMRLEQEF